MAAPAPGTLTVDEWLQHTPKYIFENHTAPLSGILLIYVSLVYSIKSLMGHVKVKNEPNNIAHAIDNAIQSFCRHKVDYRYFRESYDMFRGRYRAFLAGLRGDELDRATTILRDHMIAFKTGLAADATLENLAMHPLSTAPPDWFEKMAAILKGMPSREERNKKLGNAFGRKSNQSAAALRSEIEQLVNVHEQVPNSPDSIVDDFAVVQSLAPSSPFFQELDNDGDFRMRTRHRYVKSLDPNAKPYLDTGRIPKPTNDQSVVTQQTVSPGDSTTPRGYGKMVRVPKIAAQESQADRPTKRLKISSPSSATPQEEVFQGSHRGSIHKATGNGVSSRSVNRPLLPKPQVPQYPAFLHTGNAAQIPLGLLSPSAVGTVSYPGWPTPAPLTAAPPLQVSSAVQAPLQPQRGGDVGFSVPMYGPSLPGSTPTSSGVHPGNPASPPAASTSTTGGDMLYGTKEQTRAMVSLCHIETLLRKTRAAAMLTSGAELFKAFDPSQDKLEGLGESAASTRAFDEFCKNTTIFEEHRARVIDKFVGELIEAIVIGGHRRPGTFLTSLQSGLEGMTAELAARAAREAAQ